MVQHCGLGEKGAAATAGLNNAAALLGLCLEDRLEEMVQQHNYAAGWE